MKQFKTYDAIHRDPRNRTISVVFSTEINDKENVTGGDDAAQAGWFPLTALPQLAFDHAQILEEFFRA
jgi:8-oxo-dGTP diphosphatase